MTFIGWPTITITDTPGAASVHYIDKSGLLSGPD